MWRENGSASVIPPKSSFEQVVQDFKLQGNQYLSSASAYENGRGATKDAIFPRIAVAGWGFDTAHKLPNRILIRHIFRSSS